MRSVELFAGAGGLALGMSQAGFQHAAILEWNRSACETFRYNQQHGNTETSHWPVHECDVRQFKYEELTSVDVVSGGPPCQPFSLGGKHLGYQDDRDMFPEAVRAVRELRPKAFVFENVKGLTRSSFADYLEYVTLQLSYPSLMKRAGETWANHRSRLERHQTSNRKSAEYNVVYRLLNAANFSVPQKRERIFIVGFRSDLGIEWSFPNEIASKDALLTTQWITGEYWDRHGMSVRQRPQCSEALKKYVNTLRNNNFFEQTIAPWRTVRDAFIGLSDPAKTQSDLPNHLFVPGARAYRGHTGSAFDSPSKTLKAGAHGVPGGENMLTMRDGTVRYFTVREAARLQTFPDSYVFKGAWGEAMRQLGNAVPVQLAGIVAHSIAGALKNSTQARSHN